MYNWELSCKPKKLLPKATQPLQLEKLAANRKVYQTLLLRGQSRWTSQNNQQSFSFQLFFQKDSLIWGSVGLVGLEGVRFWIRPDSFVFLNRLEKTYAQDATSEFLQKVGVRLTLSQIAQLLLGDWIELPTSWIVNPPRLQTTYECFRWEYLIVDNFPVELKLTPTPCAKVTGPIHISYSWKEDVLTQTRISWEDQVLELNFQSWDWNKASPRGNFSIPATYQKKSLW